MTVQSDTPVSIVLPVHNQADHIEDVAIGFEGALSQVCSAYELVLVSNGCSDDSPAICERLARSSERVRAVNSQEGGWGRAVRLGLKAATGKLLGYTNTARTTPSQLAMFVVQALANPDCVIKANRHGRPGLRSLGSLIYNLECNLLFKVKSWDVNGTPKVFPRQFDKLLSLTCDDDLIDLEFMKICRDEHYQVVEVPTYSWVRHGGKSTTSLASAAGLYLGAYGMWKERRD